MMTDENENQDGARTDTCVCLRPRMVGVAGDHPAWSTVFEIEKSLLLPKTQGGFTEALLLGEASRFYRFVHALKMDHLTAHASIYEQWMTRPLSYVSDPCARIFNGVADECVKFVVAIPAATPDFGKEWRKRTDLSAIRGHRVITRDHLSGAFHLGLGGSRALCARHDAFTLEQGAFGRLKPYIDEEARKGPFVVQLHDTFWSPQTELKEFVVAAHRDSGLIRYTELPTRVMVLRDDDDAPIKMNKKSVDQLVKYDSEAAGDVAAPRLGDVSGLGVEEVAKPAGAPRGASATKRPRATDSVMGDASSTDTWVMVDASSTDTCSVCRKRRCDERAEYVPFDEADQPLITA